MFFTCIIICLRFFSFVILALMCYGSVRERGEGGREKEEKGREGNITLVEGKEL